MVVQPSSQASLALDDAQLEQEVLRALQSASGRDLDSNELERRVRRALGGPASDAPGTSAWLDGVGPLFDDVRRAARRLEDKGLVVPFTSNSWKLSPNAVAPVLPPPPTPSMRKEPQGLEGPMGRMYELLQRKGQVILYGPPGTGKTYWATRAARELAAWSWHGCSLDEAERQGMDTAGAIETCVFHPGYGYEDFIEGYRPHSVKGQTGFELRAGIFRRLCEKAGLHEGRDYYLLVDEINRGDVPRILGELLTVLEHDKRGTRVTLPLSLDPFAVPPNIYLIGTMNTADRSIALLDIALRRRFGFVELLPEPTLLNSIIGGIHLGNWLQALNERIVRHVGRDARNLQIGHAYLMSKGEVLQDMGAFASVLRDEIIPLLEEYCYEDISAVGKIIGPDLVEGGRINQALFDPSQHPELARKLQHEAAPGTAEPPRG